MVKEIRITQEDIPLIQEIYDALAKVLEDLPETITGNGKFILLAMTAVVNLACRLALRGGVPRDELMRTVAKIWDDKSAPAQAKDRVWN